ncbi:MAG: hypothetical protein JO114_12635 [Planctomycetaceae bacterium]|nr:hypothetical protein [Planctomycetaceae bacterium]
MYFSFRSRRARFSAAVRLRFGFRICVSRGSQVHICRRRAKPKIVACRSTSARGGNLDGGVTVYYDDVSRPLPDDERCFFNREACRPLDGEGVGGVDDPNRLPFAFSTQADGKVVLGIQQPGIACPGREQDQVPNSHDARVLALCELCDVTNFAANIGFDEARIDRCTLLAPTFAPLQFPFQPPLGLFAILLRV